MYRFIFFAALSISLAASQVSAAIMTFDSLPGNFDPISSYTENGITLRAASGGPEHFHDDFNFVNGTTGASIFSSDGTPLEIVVNGGASLFSLISIDVWTVDAASGPVVFTASSGATQLVDLAGPILFGAGFADITSVRIDVPDPVADRQFGIDDILVQSNAGQVPEPTSLVVFGGLALVLVARRRRQK